MPWTTIALGEAQIEPGKPRYPLNEGTAPWERMNFSAAWSSSAVVTPSRILEASSFIVRAWMGPAAAILSISCGDFLMITAGRGRSAARLELVFEAQRGDRRPDVVVDLGGRAGAVEAPQQVAALVVLDERLGLVVVDGQALGDRLRLVVVALDELGAVLVADALTLGRVELDVVGVPVLRAGAPAGQAADDLLVGHVDEQDRGQLAPDLLQRLGQGVGLGDLPREAVEQEAVLGLGAVQGLQDHADDEPVGDEVARVHVLLGLPAELGALGDGGAQDVAGGEVREAEVVREALGLGALAGARGSDQDEVEL